MTDVEAWSLAGGTCVVFSAPSPEGGTNQYAAAVIPMTETSGVVAVADGLGGQRGGARAAERAVRCLADEVRDCGPKTALRTAILDGFEAANRAVQALAVGADQFEGKGRAGQEHRRAEAELHDSPGQVHAGG